MTEPKIITVPAVPGPLKRICYQSPPLAYDGTHNPMLHCDRAKGHDGQHTWELVGAIEAATARIRELEALILRSRTPHRGDR